MALAESSGTLAEALRSLHERPVEGESIRQEAKGSQASASGAGDDAGGPYEGEMAADHDRDGAVRPLRVRPRRGGGEGFGAMAAALALGLVGAALCAAGVWAVALLLGVDVPGAQRENAKLMAWVMLAGLVIGALLLAAAVLVIRRSRSD